MSLDFSDANQQFAIMIITIVIGCTTCGVVERCGGSRAEWEVRKACVYKTGNPECKR
jgi:hypothetical protein